LEAEGERYRLLETVRQYAQDRLNESGEGDQARTRHLAFYVALAEKASPHLIGLEPRMWLLRLDLEWENLLSAHAWCDRTEGEAELGLRLVSAVRRYWFDRGLLEQGYRMTVEALTRAGAQEPSLFRCRALIAAGLLGYHLGRYGDAQGHLEEGLSIARRIGDTERVVEALHWIGADCIAQGDRAAARRHLEESLSLARDVGDKAGISNTVNTLAELHYLQGDLDVAEPLYEEGLTLQRERGNSGSITIALFNLAKVSVGRGSGDRARRLLLEALPLVEAIGSKWFDRDLLEATTCLGAFLEDWERAARFYGALQVQMEQMGRHRTDPGDEAFLTPQIARVREALGAEAFAAAVDAGRALDYGSALAEVRSWLTSAH
jgi:tetratricopeptide (TPR) repeat protein